MVKKEKFVTVASSKKEVLMVVKEGFEKIKISITKLKEFFVLVNQYRLTEKEETEIKLRKETLKRRMAKIVSHLPGLRGLQTIRDRLRTLVFQTGPVLGYNLPLLKESLGAAYEGIVKEDLQLTIILTSDYNRENLIQYLHDFFGKEATYKKLVKEEIIPRIDEKKLNQLIEERKVQLKKGTLFEKKKPAWTIKTVLIKE